MTITDTPTVTFEHVPVDELRHAPDNLRQHIGDLDELVASSRSVGIIEPIVIDEHNEVVAGNRRLAAAFEAGLTTVPCVRREIFAQVGVEIMLVENLQRAGLNPIEEATGYQRLVELGLTQRDVAERVGCNQSHVSKRIKLTKLPEAAREAVIAGDLHVNDALEVTKLPDDVVDELYAKGRRPSRWQIDEKVR